MSYSPNRGSLRCESAATELFIVLSMNHESLSFYELCPKHSKSKAWDGTDYRVRSTAFSFTVFSAVQINDYPELELAVGSFPYSSLAPPTTDERAAVTDSISIATAGSNPKSPWNLDIRIHVSSRPNAQNELKDLAFESFTGKRVSGY